MTTATPRTAEAPIPTDANPTPTNKPAHEIRLGRIKVSFWRRETSAGMRYNVTASRLYKDDEGRWKSVESFGRDDLPLLCKVIDQAHTWLFSQNDAGVLDTDREAVGSEK